MFVNLEFRVFYLSRLVPTNQEQIACFSFYLSRLVPTNQEQTACFSFQPTTRVIFLDSNFILKSRIIYSNIRIDGAGIAQSL
jgi:hypothetical protein